MPDDTRIERFQVPTLAQLEPLKSSTVDDAALCEIQGILQRYHDGGNEGDPALDWNDVLEACDKILGTCGVVSLEIEDARQYTDDGLRMCPPFSYCNAGETYAVTLARDHAEGAWVVACWGDLAEEYERDEEVGDYEVFDSCPDECPDCLKREFSLEHFPGSARGPSYSWVCDSCNHHCFAADDAGAVKIGEDDDFNDVHVVAVKVGERTVGLGNVIGVYRFAVVTDGEDRDQESGPHESAEDARQAWLNREDDQDDEPGEREIGDTTE